MNISQGHISVCYTRGKILWSEWIVLHYIRITSFLSIKLTDLGKEKSLRFELKGHPVPKVVDELLEPEELDGAQRPPVAPVDGDLQLARLFQRKTKPESKLIWKEVLLLYIIFLVKSEYFSMTWMTYGGMGHRYYTIIAFNMKQFFD